MNLKNSGLGYLSVIVSSTCFAGAGIFVKLAYKIQVDTWDLVTIQNLVASLVLFVITLLYRPGFFRITPVQAWRLALQGIVGALGTTVLFFFALRNINAGLGAMLLYTYPAFVIIGGFLFLHHRPGRKEIISLFLTLAGTVLITDLGSLDLNSSVSFGVFLGILSAITYAFYNLAGENILGELPVLQVSTWTQFFSTAALIVYKPPLFLFQNTISSEGYLLGVLLAVVTSVVPLFLLLWGISVIGSGKTAIVSTFELPVTLLLAYLVLHETVAVVQIFGAALIIGSILIVKISVETG